MILALGRFVFDTAWGKAAAIAAGAVVMFSAWLWQHDKRVVAQTKQEFGASVQKATEKARAKAVDARKPAHQPGAADRLRKSSCRDC